MRAGWRVTAVAALVALASSSGAAPDGFVEPFAGAPARAVNATMRSLPGTGVNACADACASSAGCVGITVGPGNACELLQYALEFAVVSPAWNQGSGPDAPSPDGWKYFLKIKERNDTRVSPAIGAADLPLGPPSPGTVRLLGNGPYTTAFVRNQQQYVKAWFGIDAAAGGDAADPTAGVDNLAYFFRSRAGNSDPPGTPVGWDCGLRGSAAGGIIAGASHSLRWNEDASLRKAVTQLVDAIAESVDPETGYAAAFPPNETACHENPDYVTSWVAHGLLAADEAGVPRALDTLRGHQSWLNNATWLPLFLPTDGGPDRLELPPKFNSGFGGVGATCGHLIYLEYQGLIHSTRMALSRAGTQADVDVVQDLWEERWWLKQLAARNLTAVWHRIPFAHNYEGTAINAFLDMHRLTADPLYLDASLEWWSMMREAWIDPATGVITLNEMLLYPPKSYLLTFNGYDASYPGNNPFPPTEEQRALMLAAKEDGAVAGAVAGGVLLPEHHHGRSGAHGDDHPGARTAGSSPGPIAPVCKGPQAGHHQTELSAYIGSPIGELCGHVFWVLLNSRMRRLYPRNATFADEMERSLVNVALSQSVGLGPDNRTRGIRHFTSLHRAKMPPRHVQDCCEGSGTRLFGRLPELAFSVVDPPSGTAARPRRWHRGKQLGDASGLGRVVVEQFFAATIRAPGAPGAAWAINVTVEERGFPLSGNVSVAVWVDGGAAPHQGPPVSIRVPAWAGHGSNATIPIAVDGHKAADGIPGSFATVVAAWSRDPSRPTRITMLLPMQLRAHVYEGLTTIPGHQRVAVSQGPVGLVATGRWSNSTDSILVKGVADPSASPSTWLQPDPSGPLRYTVRADPSIAFSPYFELPDTVLMDVYPAFEPA